jgi:hypothetical protein
MKIMDEKETPKKGLGSRFVSLFVNDSTDSKPVPKNIINVENTQQSIVAQNKNYIPQGVVNQETYLTLKKVLDERNLPGPDYLELKQSSDAMQSIIPDENARFLAAYATIKAGSPKITKAIILESIDEYVKYIESERTEASKEFDVLYQNEIVSRKTKIDNEAIQIEKFKSEIIELQKKISESSVNINTINSEMVSKQYELDTQKKNFDVTIDAIKNELIVDKNKLQTLIIE